MGKAGPPGRVPLEALILAFSHSRAKALVGTDALRSVLSGQYRELHHDGTFDLEPVWQLLSQQPGFDLDEVRPPLCRFKSWERDLGVTVRMPEAMSELDDRTCSELAEQVRVPDEERLRVLKGELVPSDVPEPVVLEPAVEEPAPPLRPRRTEPPRRTQPPPQIPSTLKTPRLRRVKLTAAQRRALEVASLILAVIGFAAAGLQLQRGCRSHDWDQMSTQFAGDIPLGSAERQGPEVSGQLKESGWLNLPPSVRTAQMKTALEALPREVQVFFVRDGEGHVRAVARWYGQPRQIEVSLQ
jgi:hypothetical protein